MTDRPILFSGSMVRALLEGRKTQTRRVLKPQPPVGARYSGVHFASDEAPTWFFNSPVGPRKVRQAFEDGDRLWVREAWRTSSWDDVFSPAGLQPDSTSWRYEADGVTSHDDIASYGRLRVSMHMPRWASRLTLIVTDVRVQRLQEISEADAVAEGIEPDDDGLSVWRCYAPEPKLQDYWLSPTESYRTLWNSLNAHRGYGWEANPWVAAVTFDVVKANIDQLEAADA